MPSDAQHTPVLVDEILSIFSPQPGDILLDGTLGLGGHTQAFLDAAGPAARAIGLDADKAALAKATERLQPYQDRTTLLHDNFANLTRALEKAGLADQVFSHILFDLGVGSHQLGDETRGFTFRGAGSLNMMYSPDVSLPMSDITSLNILTRRLGYNPDVEDVIRGVSVDELTSIIRTLSEERFAKRIATALKERIEMVKTAQDLARVITEACPPNYEQGRIHPATRTFQALRMAVNRELECLRTALPQAVQKLAPGGKVAVISFHSLEDRIVKHYFRHESKGCICPPEQPVCTCQHVALLDILTKKPVMATSKEREKNPRARSAKLRVARKR